MRGGVAGVWRGTKGLKPSSMRAACTALWTAHNTEAARSKGGSPTPCDRKDTTVVTGGSPTPCDTKDITVVTGGSPTAPCDTKDTTDVTGGSPTAPCDTKDT